MIRERGSPRGRGGLPEKWVVGGSPLGNLVHGKEMKETTNGKKKLRVKSNIIRIKTKLRVKILKYPLFNWVNGIFFIPLEEGTNSLQKCKPGVPFVCLF